MAAAVAGKKSTTSLFLFVEAFGLEVEDELSTMSSQNRKMVHGTTSMAGTDSWSSDFGTVERTCRSGDVRDKDLGIKWPHWHTLIFSDETIIDMRSVCKKKKTFKRCRCRGPDRFIGRCGQQTTSMNN